MSVDAQRLQDVAGYLWMVWSSPLQIAIAVYMLWGIVGPSVLAGLAIMVLLIPVNGIMATIQRNLQVGYRFNLDRNTTEHQIYFVVARPHRKHFNSSDLYFTFVDSTNDTKGSENQTDERSAERYESFKTLRLGTVLQG